jgi:hypothetical protein
MRSGFGYRWIYVTPSACGNTGGYRRKRGHPGSYALEALANVQEGLRWDERNSPQFWWCCCCVVVTSVAGRNNCGCLDDLFYLCTGVADALGNNG